MMSIMSHPCRHDQRSYAPLLLIGPNINSCHDSTTINSRRRTIHTNMRRAVDRRHYTAQHGSQGYLLSQRECPTNTHQHN